MEQIGRLIVITGGTVSGKDTVVTELLKINPSWKKIITTTTRKPRPDEQDGRDYFFVDNEKFQKMKNDNEFLETVEYAGNHYGTTKSAFNPVLQGQTLIWRIDASRAMKVNKLFDDSFDEKIAHQLKENTKVIYIKLPDDETRRLHFLKRNMQQSDIDKRIKQDQIDSGNFKNIIINYDGYLEKTIEGVEIILNS